MFAWLNPLRWLQALLRWLKYSWKGSPEQVPGKESDFSTANSENSAAYMHRKPVPEQVLEQETRKLTPPPHVQAQALLSWLQERYSGYILQASGVENVCYPQLAEEKGWRQQPWVGRHGVGKYLTDLTGGKKRSDYFLDENGDKRRVRTYLIPHPLAPAPVVELPVRKRA